MALEHITVSQLFEDVYKHRRSATTFRTEVRIIAAGEEILVPEMINLRTIRDYMNATHDVTLLSVQVPITHYIDKVYPNKQELMVEIKYKMSGPKGEKLDYPDIWIRKYKAILTDPVKPSLVQSDRQPVEGHVKAISSLYTIKLQLIDRIAYEMSFQQCAGIFPNSNVQSIIQTFLSYKLRRNEQRKPLINKDFEEVRGCDIVPCDNTQTGTHFIPSGTKVVDMPAYLQREFGVYNTDIGYYYQMNYTTEDFYQTAKGGWWFVYPLYNFTRFNSAPRTLTVFVLPEKESLDMEKTFTYFDKQLFIFTTGASVNADYTEYDFYEKGNGIQFHRAEEVRERWFKTENNRVYPDPQQTKRTASVYERKDNINDTRPVPGFFTENPYKYISQLSKANTVPLAVSWTNAMPDLIIPGMPVKVMFLNKSEIEEVDATVVSVDIINKKIRNSFVDDPYTTSANLTLLLDER